MDPLSDVLSLLKPQSYLSGGFEAKGPWRIQFPDQQGAIKCAAVLKGQCQLAIEGFAEPLHLNEGDAVLLPGGKPFEMGSRLDIPSLTAQEVFGGGREGAVTRVNGGGEFAMVSCRFVLASRHARTLLALLPGRVHIRKDQDSAALPWAMQRMMQEMQAPQPGSYLMLHHLAHITLLQALRLHLSDGALDSGNWLAGLADPMLRLGINAMHQEPARRWTLAELAAKACMSRSTFALRFKQVVGDTPMEYLARWRMLKAADRLEHGTDTLACIAADLGYGSESAFSSAFKRVMGCAPRHFNRGGPAP